MIKPVTLYCKVVNKSVKLPENRGATQEFTNQNCIDFCLIVKNTFKRLNSNHYLLILNEKFNWNQLIALARAGNTLTILD